LEQKLKKISCYRAWLLLMQFPSRKVDFSNPGADRAVPGGEILISSLRSWHQIGLPVALSNCGISRLNNKGFKSQMPVSDGAKLHPFTR
jgi:hypothetical protein